METDLTGARSKKENEIKEKTKRHPDTGELYILYFRTYAMSQEWLSSVSRVCMF